MGSADRPYSALGLCSLRSLCQCVGWHRIFDVKFLLTVLHFCGAMLLRHYRSAQEFDISDLNSPLTASTREETTFDITAAKSPPEFDKFITTKENCEGLGNQIWRFASLYAIGRATRRSPYYDASERCMADYEREIGGVFPEFYRRFHFRSPRRHETTRLIDFGTNCCQFNDPAHEQNVPESARTLCVHTRMGDFYAHNRQTKPDFVREAVNLALGRLKASSADALAVMLLGEDKDFLRSLTFDEGTADHVLIPDEMSRGRDLCFAYASCDALIITAGYSTYSWWIGYLMADEAPVFYDRMPGNVFGRFMRSNFLPEWTPI